MAAQTSQNWSQYPCSTVICKTYKNGTQVPGAHLIHWQVFKMTIIVNTKQSALEWDVELVAAHPLRAALQFNLKV